MPAIHDVFPSSTITGVCYSSGIGVTASADEGMRYYRLAAWKGHPQAIIIVTTEGELIVNGWMDGWMT